MRYRKVESYYRQPLFDFYRRLDSPFYALTFELDMTRLKAFADERGHSTHLSLCYFFTRALRAVEDFRYRYRDGEIVLYDELHPSTIVPAPGGLFSFAYLEYRPDVEAFHHDAEARVREAGREVSLPSSEHSNHVFYSALPGVPFTGLTHARPNRNTDAEPRVTFGRFRRRRGRLRVPVGIAVNHVFIDGKALGELYEEAQRVFDDPD